jgi:response regulator RpfG family c-di-GMP phosphodiesterase
MDQSLKLLIIDDDEYVLANLCYFLADKKYDVISATNGLEGLKLIENEQQRFDLIIELIPSTRAPSGAFPVDIKKDTTSHRRQSSNCTAIAPLKTIKRQNRVDGPAG